MSQNFTTAAWNPNRGSTSAEWAAARDGAAVFDLSQRGQVELVGADAVQFLHNLCTNDIKSLQPGRGCEFFVTNNKARVAAHGFAHRLVEANPPTLLLDLDSGTASKVAAHLNRFVVSEQVEIADRSNAISLIHLCGPKATDILTSVFPTLPALEDLQHVVIDGYRITRHKRLELPGFEVVCPTTAAENLSKQLLAAGAVAAGPETFNILRVEAGVPQDGIDFDAERFVVEVGRIKQAISYTKGCYLGQEPIVMARDRGHANRALLGLKVQATDPMSPGTKVFRAGEEVGQVTSSVCSPLLKSVIALAYLKRGHQDPGTEVEVEGKMAVVACLPFASE